MPLSLISIIPIVAGVALLVLVYIIFTRRSRKVDVALAHVFDRLADLEHRLSFLETNRRQKAPVLLTKAVNIEDDTRSVSTGFSSVDEEETLSVYDEEPIVAPAVEVIEPALNEASEPAPELSTPELVLNSNSNELPNLGEGTSE